MNKRGNETGSAFIWLILAIAVAVIIALFFFGGFGTIETMVDAQKPEIQAVVGHCNTAFTNVLGGGSSDEDTFAKYCASFSAVEVPVGSVKSYVTCAFLEKQEATVFSENSVSKTVKDACGDDNMKKAAYNKCLEYNKTNSGSDKNWKVYLNGVECSKKTAKNSTTLATAFDLSDQGNSNPFSVSLS